MTLLVILKLSAVAFLVLLNGFFVAAEFAIVKVRATQIDLLLMRGSMRARTAKHVIEHMDAYLSATQFGITLASLGLGWIGEPAVARLLEPLFIRVGVTSLEWQHTLSVTVGFAIITFLHIVFGELAPKSIAIRKSKQVALITAVPMKIFFGIFMPAITLLNGTSNLILRWAGIRPAGHDEVSHSEEELRLLISEGIRSGAVDQTEHEIIQSVFEFNDKSVREIMTPRHRVVTVGIHERADAVLRRAVDEEFSRFPVYEGAPDNVVGVLHGKDLFREEVRGKTITVRTLMRPPFFVPETKKIGNLLRIFQRKKLQVGIVLNEYGGWEGIVTMEDILEEIVGEIRDEYDVEPRPYEMKPDGSALMDPSMSVRDFNSAFRCALPLDPDYDTLTGFLFKEAGKVPDEGEVIPYGDLRFTIIRKVGLKLVQVRVTFDGKGSAEG